MITLIKGSPPSKPESDKVYIERVDNTINITYKTMTTSTNINNLGGVFHSWQEFLKRLDPEFGVYKHIANKEHRDRITAWLGIGPTKLHKIFKKIIYELVIEELQPYAKRLCLTPSYKTKGDQRTFKRTYKFDFVKIWQLIDCFDKIKQLELDRLLHLSPLVFIHNQDTHFLKNHYKQHWKHLANNSFTRNLLICKHMNKIYFRQDNGLIIYTPSTILKKNLRFVDAMAYSMYKKSGLYYKDWDNSHADLYSDMVSMANKLGRNPCPKLWSDVQKLHYRYTQELLSAEISTISNEPITHVIEPFSVEVNGSVYQCTPLTSRRDLYTEGKKMHHCVYSYADSVTKHSYYVVHVEHNTERSTLGLSMHPTGAITVDQHYGHCNDQTPNRKADQAILQHIKQQLNEVINDNTLYTNNTTRLNRAF